MAPWRERMLAGTGCAHGPRMALAIEIQGPTEIPVTSMRSATPLPPAWRALPPEGRIYRRGSLTPGCAAAWMRPDGDPIRDCRYSCIRDLAQGQRDATAQHDRATGRAWDSVSVRRCDRWADAALARSVRRRACDARRLRLRRRDRLRDVTSACASDNRRR